MQKYLMFDHGGVLDGEFCAAAPGKNDLVLLHYDEGGCQVLRNGVQIVEMLNRLVNDHGYRILFHSKNKENDQLRLLQQLIDVCAIKGLKFPQVTAMAVCDPQKYPNVYPADPVIEQNIQYGIHIAGYGHEGDGKACVRTALSQLLDIHDRSKVIVFDDGESVIQAAKAENYQTKLIGGNGNTLFEALSSILKVNDLKNMYDPRASTAFAVNNERQRLIVDEDEKKCCSCTVL